MENHTKEMVVKRSDETLLDLKCNLKEEQFDVGAAEGLNLQMELDSLLINDFGEVFDDISGAFEALPLYGFDEMNSGGQVVDLPDFDFDLGNEELSSWIEEPLNIACCPI